jgi:hypothetical protein
VDSEDSWTAALRTLIVNPQLRSDIGRRGRTTIEERYSADASFALLDKHVFSQVAQS